MTTFLAEGAATVDLSTISTALVNGFSTAASSMIKVIGDIVPVALPVLVCVLVVRVGINIFKTAGGSGR